MLKIYESFHSIKKLASPLGAFFIGTLLTCSAYGLLSSTLALRLNAAAVPTFYTGLILSIYYAGYIFATFSSYKIINKVGHIRAFSAYISILSALVLGHAIYFSPLYWGCLRFMEGYCLASSMICLESWLNTRSTNKNRGIIMSLYMITSYLGAALGQLLLNIPDTQGFIIFILVSALYSVALVPISLTALPSPDISKHASMSLKQLYKISPVGVVCCGISGVLVGGIYILGAIYARQSGLNVEFVSLFMFFCIIGGMSAQLPIGRLSDRFDRRFVMVGAASILLFLAPWIHFFINDGVICLSISAFLLGCGSFIFYPISVSHINDLISDEERTEASGMLIMIQSFGMIAGPIIISFFMQQFGPISFLVSFSVVNGIFVLFALRHIRFKPEINYINQTPTHPVPFVPTTQVYHEIARPDDESSSFIGKMKKILSKRPW